MIKEFFAKSKRDQLTTQPGRPFSPIVLVMLAMLIVMTVVETGKHFLFPDLSTWEDHIITIITSTVAAIIIGFFVMNKSQQLHQKALEEIAERKRAEQELSKSREMLENITQGITENILLISRDFRILWANKTALEAHGSGIIGDYCYKATHQSESRCEPPLDPCPLSDLPKEGKSLTLNHIHYDKQGNKRHVEVDAYPVMDEKGEIFQFIHVSKDITERKQAEEALRKSEEEGKRLAQENALVAEMGRIIGSTLNIEEVFGHFSEAVAKLIPFDRIQINLGSLLEDNSYVRYVAGTDVPHRRAGEYVPLTGTATVECFRTKSSLLLQPKDAKEVEELGVRFPRLLPNLEAGMRSAILVPLITKDETIGVLSLRTTKTKAYTDPDVRLVESIASQIAGAVANAQSFAELKQAEEALKSSEDRYQQLVEQPFIGIHIHSQGQVLFMNQAGARILGAEDPTKFIGKLLFSFIHPDYHEIVKERIQTIHATAQFVPLIEEKFVRLDGKIIDVEIAASIHTYEGRPAVQVVFQDITERKQAEAERENLVRELQKALSEVKTLKGIFPICASCKKIRDDKGYWNQVEVYIRDHSEAEFSHSICPECMKKLYGNLLEEKDTSKK